jgi:hypothetical protein
MENRIEPMAIGYQDAINSARRWPPTEHVANQAQLTQGPSIASLGMGTQAFSSGTLGSQLQLYFGKEDVRHIPIPLRSGPLTMMFDTETAALRNIRCGHAEVVRGIYGAVRDQFWSTVPPHLSNIKVEAHEDSFRLLFDVHCLDQDIEFFWHGEITGDSRGKIGFTFDGEARSSFLRQRIGLCLLHPVSECAGKPCMMEMMDGTQVQTVFPYFIAAQSPMQEVQAITHEVESGLWAEVRFSGDVFEMEDQRNWGDDSYKTYSTPLDLPHPVLVSVGDRVQQSVTLSLFGQSPRLAIDPQEPHPELTLLDQTAKPKPALGLCYASHGAPLSTCELDRLRQLGLSHLRLDLRLHDASWRTLLQQATLEARALGIHLHLALHLTDNAEHELNELAREVIHIDCPVSLWMVFHLAEAVTSEKWILLARNTLKPLGYPAPFAAGTDGHFADLNRNRPAIDNPTLPCFSINAQVHACDHTTVMENLGAQRYTVETLRQFSRSPAVVSPITLRPRFHPGNGRIAFPTELGILPPHVDLRQMSLFGASWTLGSLATLMGTGNLDSLTYYETTGWLGVMETEAGSPLPDRFPSIPGSVFPMYHVFADLADCDRVLYVQNSHPSQVQGLGLIDKDHRRRILVANLTGQTMGFSIKAGGNAAHVRFLDEINAWESIRTPDVFRKQLAAKLPLVCGRLTLKILPYALARVDLE